MSLLVLDLEVEGVDFFLLYRNALIQGFNQPEAGLKLNHNRRAGYFFLDSLNIALKGCR
ncbi:hypothetical protein D3C84_1075850 [compost metagenome]